MGTRPEADDPYRENIPDGRYRRWDVAEAILCKRTQSGEALAAETQCIYNTYIHSRRIERWPQQEYSSRETARRCGCRSNFASRAKKWKFTSGAMRLC